MKKLLFLITTTAILTTALASCSKDENTKKEDTIHVTGVALTPPTTEMTPGGTLTLTATVLPDDATNKTISWTSNALTVATVNDNGLVTAVAPGTAVITVTTQDGNKTAACTVTVTNAEMTMTTEASYVLLELAGTGTATIDWGDGTSTTHTLSLTAWTEYYHTLLYGSSPHTITITGNNITGIDCFRIELTALDVSKNTALTELYCEGNSLTTLDVSKNTALTDLCCGFNLLTTLDVSKNTALTELCCEGNLLTTLDVSKNTALTELYCIH